jgi:hypothetical protein
VAREIFAAAAADGPGRPAVVLMTHCLASLAAAVEALFDADGGIVARAPTPG